MMSEMFKASWGRQQKILLLAQNTKETFETPTLEVEAFVPPPPLYT